MCDLLSPEFFVLATGLRALPNSSVLILPQSSAKCIKISSAASGSVAIFTKDDPRMTWKVSSSVKCCVHGG